MTEPLTHKVHLTECDDGTFIAASITNPLFCVAGDTVNEAKQKAQRALNYHGETANLRAVRTHRTVTQFTPIAVEDLELKVA